MGKRSRTRGSDSRGDPAPTDPASRYDSRHDPAGVRRAGDRIRADLHTGDRGEELARLRGKTSRYQPPPLRHFRHPEEEKKENYYARTEP